MLEPSSLAPFSGHLGSPAQSCQGDSILVTQNLSEDFLLENLRATHFLPGIKEGHRLDLHILGGVLISCSADGD